MKMSCTSSLNAFAVLLNSSVLRENGTKHPRGFPPGQTILLISATPLFVKNHFWSQFFFFSKNSLQLDVFFVVPKKPHENGFSVLGSVWGVPSRDDFGIHLARHFGFLVPRQLLRGGFRPSRGKQRTGRAPSTLFRVEKTMANWDSCKEKIPWMNPWTIFLGFSDDNGRFFLFFSRGFCFGPKSVAQPRDQTVQPLGENFPYPVSNLWL